MTLTLEQIERFRAGLRDECDPDTQPYFDVLCDMARERLTEGTFAEGIEAAKTEARKHLGDTGMLLSNPPKSSAIWRTLIGLDELRQAFEELASKQARLEPEFQNAIFSNVEELYEP